METDILKKALQEIMDIDIGVYPKAVHGTEKNDYLERTPYMNGWNEATVAFVHEIIQVLEDNKITIYDDKVVINDN